MVARGNQYQRGRAHERSPLRPQGSSTFYGTTPRSPGSQPPPYEPGPAYGGCGYQATDVHQDQREPPSLLPTKITAGSLAVPMVFFIILAQAISFIFFYDLPTKLDSYNKATARMREQQDVMRREAGHLESERIALRGESNRLEKERLALDLSTLEMEEERNALESAIHRSEQERSRLELEKQLLEDKKHLLEHEKKELRKEREKWEKAREDRVPQGAFWNPIEPWSALACQAYGKREYWAELQNIPKDWTDMDACMNMPVEIKGESIRRPDRCGYVAGSPHIHGFWMVGWGQTDCQPWHQDITDKVSSGQPTRLHFRIRLVSRTPISRVALLRDLAFVVSKPGLWVSMIAQNKTGVGCARPRLLHGITSHIIVPPTARQA